MKGLVYLLTNPAMPGIVKIGLTTRGDMNQRLQELFTTGVPVPFDCVQDREISLTQLTTELMGLDYNVQPTSHWSYEGRSLRDIYNETFSDDI